MRVAITDRPFDNVANPKQWGSFGVWPARWIDTRAKADSEPRVMAYRLRFSVEERTTVRFHVSADERYELFLNGFRLGRGPERGDRENWFFETYEVSLRPGEHTLVARTWWLGPHAPSPYAQMSVRSGFLLAGEGEAEGMLSTGIAAWEGMELDGYSWLDKEQAWGCGAKVRVDAAKLPEGLEYGKGTGWGPVQVVGRAFDDRGNDAEWIWHLRPALLPPMMEDPTATGIVRHLEEVDTDQTRRIVVDPAKNLAAEAAEWDAMLLGVSTVVVPPQTRRRAIVDLENYFCGYPEVQVSGGKGSRIRVHWAESLYERGPGEKEWIGHMDKGDRSKVEGRIFWGVGDEFLPSGRDEETLSTLWWEAGRYLEVLIETGDEALTLHHVGFRETHYPYPWRATFDCSDPRLGEVIPLALRVLEMCSHETYMDCPYYEQLMYVGDTRLEVLTTYAATDDRRLPRKAIEMFDVSRRPDGLTFSRYPSNVTQYIPPFSLWWIAMVHDAAKWTDDAAFIRARMPGVRAVLDFFLRHRNAEGVLEAPVGWNYFDWIGELSTVPPGTRHGLYNWKLAYVLKRVAELEEYVGEPEQSARASRLGEEVAEACHRTFFCEERGLYADDEGKTSFSEHTQCLALLSGYELGERRERVASGLLEAEDLTRTTIYFTHYLFEAYREIGAMDRLVERLGLWFDLKANGLCTTTEHPEPTRSDCHAWGAHPLFHYLATFLGIRPAEWGFRAVEIRPALGPLEWATGTMAHPLGSIHVEVRPDGVAVELPDGLSGNLEWQGRTVPLNAGLNRITAEGGEDS